MALAIVLAGGLFGCSSAAHLAGQGEACAVVTDCQEGLICCNGMKGSLTCADSVLCIQPGGSGQPTGTMAGADASSDAANGIADGDAAPQELDTGLLPEADPSDQRSPPPVDAGRPPPVDAGRPVDASTPDDTGSRLDVSTVPMEAGAPDASAD